MSETHLSLNVVSRGMSRRGALSLLLSGAGAGLLAACAPPVQAPTVAPATAVASGATVTSPSPGAAPSAVASAVAKPAAQPKSGGTLRLGSLDDLTSLDGHQPSP